MTSTSSASGPGAPDHDHEATGPEEHSAVRSVLEWIAVIGGALVVALAIKTFLLQAFFIPSGSMETTLEIGDRVLVNKLSYRLHEVNRGDLVVFETAEGEGECGLPVNEAAAAAAQGGIRDLIKRVIGLPGDTVEGRDNQVLVNGRILEEPYLDEGEVIGDFEPVEVPEGCVFVMGDNRDDSRDSRAFGSIDEDRIVGRAFVRVWPLSSLSFL